MSREPVVLLDVDGTLIIQLPNGERVLNDALLFGLKALRLKNIYLFTNMSVRSDLSAWIDNSHHITRHKIARFFKENDISLRGIITPADVEYNKGLSAAYRDYYVPVVEALIDTGNVHDQNNKNLDVYVSHRQLFDDQVTALTNNLTTNQQAVTPENCKVAMFNYFKSKSGNASKTIYYFDDDVKCLNAVQGAHETASAPLFAYQVPVYQGESDFSKNIQKSVAIQLLSMYINIRTSEMNRQKNAEHNSIWAKLFSKDKSRDASVKLSVANKLLQYLSSSTCDELNEDDMLACRNGRLKELLKGNAVLSEALEILKVPQQRATSDLTSGMMD